MKIPRHEFFLISSRVLCCLRKLIFFLLSFSNHNLKSTEIRVSQYRTPQKELCHKSIKLKVKPTFYKSTFYFFENNNDNNVLHVSSLWPFWFKNILTPTFKRCIYVKIFNMNIEHSSVKRIQKNYFYIYLILELMDMGYKILFYKYTFD